MFDSPTDRVEAPRRIDLLRLRNDSLQLTAKHQVATPVNWKPGEEVIIAGSVSDEEAKRRYPKGWKAPKPYIRIDHQNMLENAGYRRD